MTRSYIVPGPCMVSVIGGAHLSGTALDGFTQLGLATDQITITPTFYRSDVRVDDFGPNCPVDKQQMMASVNISMNLINVDQDVMDICWNESLGGGLGEGTDPTRMAGDTLAPAGRLLSRFRNRLWSGWHYIGVTLAADDLGVPWTFLQATLADQPFSYPMGTEVSVVNLNWQAIPYCPPWLSGGTAGTSGAITVDGQVYFPRPQMQSSGAQIWNRVGFDGPAGFPNDGFPEDLPEG